MADSAGKHKLKHVNEAPAIERWPVFFWLDRQYPALYSDMIRRFTAVEEPLDLDLSLPAHGQRNNGGGQTENLAMMPAAERESS